MEPAALAAAGADLGLVTATGALLALDRRGAFQLMLSQPLVAVPLLGLLLGDVVTAVWLGSLLQLLWMSSVLFGANVPPNETLASVAIGGMVLLYGRHFGEADIAAWTLAILLGAPLARLGRSLDIRIDQANRALAERADTAARAGQPSRLAILPPLGLLRTFLANAIVLMLATSLGLAALVAMQRWRGPSFEYALQLVGLYCLPALGLAVALSVVRRRRSLVLALVSFALMLTALPGGT